MTELVVRAGLLVTGAGEELSSGWVRAVDGEIAEVGSGDLPRGADETLDEPGCVLVPGLVNAHDHLYQWGTRGLAATEGLFGWLRTLYPIWAGLDAEVAGAAARAAIARLLRSGCTLTSDHHYVFPRGREGILEALVGAARELGIRFQPSRGSMSLGASQGGLPPDEIVESHDAILAATEDAVAALHDPAPGSMCRLSVAPCSPFSVTLDLLRDSAELARRHGLRLHTHLAETVDEEAYCQERFGKRPVELLDDVGWLGPDVWVAHAIHLADAEVSRLGATRTGVAHCPSSNERLGAGACRVADLLDAGAPVGLGVDGAASNEDANLAGEVRQALLLARLRAALLGQSGAAATLTPRGAWDLAWGGAACLGRDDVSAIVPGRRCDVALFRVDDLVHSGMPDPLEALALASPPGADTVVVEGRVVVREGRLLTADEDALARELADASRRMQHA
jgi:cytosine/adenosine deaminase-related metal-dependent hydrolase